MLFRSVHGRSCSHSQVLNSYGKGRRPTCDFQQNDIYSVPLSLSLSCLYSEEAYIDVIGLYRCVAVRNKAASISLYRAANFDRVWLSRSRDSFASSAATGSSVTCLGLGRLGGDGDQ